MVLDQVGQLYLLHGICSVTMGDVSKKTFSQIFIDPDNEIFSEEKVRYIKLFDNVIDSHFHGVLKKD